MKKKLKKNKNINQTSFYFEDYIETNKKKKISKKTVAILAIHFGGQAYDFHKIKKEIY